MTYRERITSVLQKGWKTIAEIWEAVGRQIPRPSIRKILSTGAIKEEFTRIAKGVYTLTAENGDSLLWVECGDSLEVLSDMMMEGKKFDMIFLDPPYYSKQLVGRNRLKQKDWYAFITPEEFHFITIYCKHLLRTPDSPVYLMLSGAASAAQEMYAYTKQMEEAEFKLVQKGTYHKVYRNGNPVLNIRGEISSAEIVYCYTTSGNCSPAEVPVKWHHAHIRQDNSYRTQKAVGFLERLVRQSTWRGQSVLDAFGGSGNMVTACINSGRKLTIIDKAVEAVENFIKQKAVWPKQITLV